MEVEAPLAPGLAPGLRPEARAFLLGQAEAPFLRLLGEGPLPSLGPRGTEALALLLAHEAGLSGEALGEALYGEPNPGALKALLHRLREKGFRIACSPYRLENPPPRTSGPSSGPSPGETWRRPSPSTKAPSSPGARPRGWRNSAWSWRRP